MIDLSVLLPASVNYWKKLVADDHSYWAEANKKINKQQNGFRKKRSTNDNLLKHFETVKLGFCKGHPTTGIFHDVEKFFGQVWYGGFLFMLTSLGLNRKLIRWISNFLYQRKLIISINDQLIGPITSSIASLNAVLSLLFYLSYMLATSFNLFDAQVNLP